MKKMLIAYYSWSNGNTRKVAEQLQKKTDADIVEIQTVTPYSGTYDEVVRQGQKEVERGYMPDIRPLSVNLSDYDVIAVGTPTWWYTMAPAVHTFLQNNSFEGKTVIPFMTNGGWPGHVIKDMKKLCKGSFITCEKEFQFDSEGGSQLITAQKEIEKWIQNVIHELK